ncbi:e296e49f-989c-40b0-813a-552f2e75e4df [Sclerotinia trifoliorum]|uniref:Probable acetate kinase n=1 Tax=Sclerotinia trifoliorum TaxID=28548 RepID=A0A8H2VYZ8_9HELO|nr:e296e49f-989c-40b0-813a-552f2e75e4df [Sclerotinia trifoliorum]
MSKIILSINAGSSSVKISIFSATKNHSPTQLAECQISGLTSPPATLKYTRSGTLITKDEELEDGKISDQKDAFQYILTYLINDASFPQIAKVEDIAIASHRVVHGGDYKKSKIITNETYHHLETLTDLAPLHNASALSIISHCISTLPSTRNIAVFDSEFHASIPEHISTYPINQEIARKNGLRKYGFHGISYAFITRSVAGFLGKKEEDTNIIALHLGSGASACAVKGGRSWDTSMGLTPLAGLPGATRSGSLDPSLVFHYATNVGKLSPSSTTSLHISRAEEILNQESGWKSLTGTTNFGTIISSSTNPQMKLALDIFIDRILSYIGHYYVSLHGKVDALVFAGGIGEKSEVLRKRVVDEVGCLGFEIDEEKNGREMKEVVQDVGREGARHRTMVCLTDEQFEMARHCVVDEELFGE